MRHIALKEKSTLKYLAYQIFIKNTSFSVPQKIFCINKFFFHVQYVYFDFG